MFFKSGFPPWILVEVLKNKLKSPPSVTLLFTILQILFGISDRLVRVSNCFSVFALYRLRSRSSLSQIFISNIKILPWWSFLVSTTSKDFEPRKAIATLQEVVVPWEQTIFPLKLSLHCFSSSTEECVSWRKTKKFGKELILSYSNTFILLTRLLNSLHVLENKA